VLQLDEPSELEKVPAGHTLQSEEPALPALQEALQPVRITEPSEYHWISMIPVLEVTELGIVEPE